MPFTVYVDFKLTSTSTLRLNKFHKKTGDEEGIVSLRFGIRRDALHIPEYAPLL